jgi:pilus assembly protein Flp/PilA
MARKNSAAPGAQATRETTLAVANRVKREWAMHVFIHICRCRRGGAAIEYALVAVIIAIAALAAMHSLGNSIGNKYTGVSTAMDSAT